MQMIVLAKRSITLIEIMIVMFLIALITGVVAYNYRDTLEEGKAFKTRTSIQKIETILNLNLAEHPENANNLSQNWKAIVQRSPLVQNADNIINDGWGQELKVDYDSDNNVLHVYSTKLNEFDHRKGS